jgi:hypothetical protein
VNFKNKSSLFYQSKKLELIAFIAEALKEDRLLQAAIERREKIRSGEGKILSLEELKARLYGEAI